MVRDDYSYSTRTVRDDYSYGTRTVQYSRSLPSTSTRTVACRDAYCKNEAFVAGAQRPLDYGTVLIRGRKTDDYEYKHHT